MGKSPNFIDRWLKQCEGRVGIIPALAGLLLFSVFAITAGVYKAAFAAIGGFAVFGMAESFHIYRKTNLNKRCSLPHQTELFFNTAEKHPMWKPKVLKESYTATQSSTLLGLTKCQFPFPSRCHIAPLVVVRSLNG